MACMCGATDCPSCGRDQGYEVVQVWTANGWEWRNPEDIEDEQSADEESA